MSEQLAKPDNAAIIERVVVQGDLSKLSPEERVAYYRAVCDSVGLNPLTKPFDYIVLSGRLTLYARKDATDQLRRLHGVSVTRVEREQASDIYEVTVFVTDKTGRQDVDTGAVYTGKLAGMDLANARMKALTKAKRRATLSLVGLGWLDESEIEAVPDARPVAVDLDTGEIVEPPARQVLPPTPAGNGKPAPTKAPAGNGNDVYNVEAIMTIANRQLNERGVPDDMHYRHVGHVIGAYKKAVGHSMPPVPRGQAGYDQATAMQIVAVLLDYKIGQVLAGEPEGAGSDTEA